jgi:4-hydroxybenzoate polyprenyltransferase
MATELYRPWGPTWIQALRPHQWSKNFLVFVPLFVGHAFGNSEKIIAAAYGFVIVCVLASASYLVNDLADLDSDRHHPAKKKRSPPPLFYPQASR